MIKSRGPKRQLVMTFHSKDSGARHGPIIQITGGKKYISDVHAATAKDIQKTQPHFKNITPRLSESNVGTTVGFHGISQNDWNTIFRKKRPKK